MLPLLVTRQPTALTVKYSKLRIIKKKWWVVTGSNRRHSRCKRDALPTELTTLCAAFNPRCTVAASPLFAAFPYKTRSDSTFGLYGGMVGDKGFEPLTSSM